MSKKIQTPTASKRRDTKPRKAPTQQRSIDNVERILKAAASVLAEDGYDNLKTVTIAKRANAAVGSVYQYFPNKHAIMTMLVERWLATDNQALEIVESRSGDYPSITDEFIDLAELLLSNYKRQEGLLALVNLCRNIPELYETEEAHDKQYAKRLVKILDRHNLATSADEKLALTGYFTIIVDATAMSIATDTDKRAKLKTEFLKNSIRDLFARYPAKS